MTVQLAAPGATVQPSVLDASLAATTAGAPTGVLARPSGTALHVLQDARYVLLTVSLRGTCTREEWDAPAYRRLAIARAWQRAVAAKRADDEEFVAFAPVTLYCTPTGDVRYADVRLPADPGPKFITADGRRVIGAPGDLALLVPARTTYARWAEGPLPRVDTEMADAPTPDEDRDIQALRHQNRALRELIDGSLGPAEWAPAANDSTRVDDLVDFRIRGVFRRRDFRKFESKQTGDVSHLVIDGHAVHRDEFDPTTASGLDAILEAD